MTLDGRYFYYIMELSLLVDFLFLCYFINLKYFVETK